MAARTCCSLLGAGMQGIMFLATPHHDCAAASRALCAALGPGMGLGFTLRRDLLVALRLDSRQLADIDAEFCLHHARLHTIGFYETRKMRVTSLAGFLNHVVGCSPHV